MKLATSSQMRELDRRAVCDRGIPSIDLMERAAAHVAEAALELLAVRPGRARISVLCGVGNNGGDGIAAARLLFLRGTHVRAFLVGSYGKLTPDSMEETRRLSECGVELESFTPGSQDKGGWIATSHVMMDALIAVGLSRQLVSALDCDAVFDHMY